MPFSRRRLLAVAPAASGGGSDDPRRSHGGATTTDLRLPAMPPPRPAVSAAGGGLSRTLRRAGPRVPDGARPCAAAACSEKFRTTSSSPSLPRIDQAEQAGLVAPGARAGPWRNRLVTAAANDPAGPEGSFAVPDPSPASDIDGAAILQRLGAAPAKVLGVLDTGAVAWMLTNGGARQGLLHQTEVAADERLRAVAPVPDDAWPPILYAAVVTKLARRGDPAAFVAFLGSPEGLAVLRSAGLETAT